MTTPAFTFKSATTSRGLISSGEGSAEFYHPLLPMTFFSAAGFLLILNGWNLNRAQSDIVGYDGTTTTAVQMLQMRAPRQPIMPMLSWIGTGRVFRPGAKYRYRWYNSATGQFSGLSDIPDAETNMGMVSPAGSTTYLGQTAYFYLATASKPPHADTIQLFANSTQEDTIWYLADSQPTGSSSYVMLTDDSTDDELEANEFVVSGSDSAQPPGPSWSEGIMDPRCKAYLHSSGRVFYFGMRRFGRIGPLAVVMSVTQGSDLGTIGASSTDTRLIEPGRVGQRIRFFSDLSSTPIVDPTVYRIVKAETATTVRFQPPIAISSNVAEGATANLYYAIEDDRDARFIYMSEPNIPWLIDPLKTLAVGEDFDDGVMGIFTVKHPSSFGFSVITRAFVQTRRSLYEMVNSDTENPFNSTTFSIVRPEGVSGLDAGCSTPFGWCYFHEILGPRLFDGRVCAPLGRPLGQGTQSGGGGLADDPFQIFLARTQFQNIDPACVEDIVMTYDPDNHSVILSYIPLGGSTLRESLVFSATDRTWRGPYRECHVAAGKMRGSTTSEQLITGDSFGNLIVREAQALDVLPTITTFTGTGTISSVTTNRVFVDSGATYNADGDKRLRGCPIWFTDGTDLWFARIADVLSATQLELDGPPIREDGTIGTLTTGWIYGVGSIRWSAATA